MSNFSQKRPVHYGAGCGTASTTGNSRDTHGPRRETNACRRHSRKERDPFFLALVIAEGGGFRVLSPDESFFPFSGGHQKVHKTNPPSAEIYCHSEK